MDQWIADDVKVSRGGNKTIREYTDVSNQYIKPFIGHLKFQRLTTLQCKNWQGELQRSGFTPNMRQKSMRVFSVAIHAAIRSDVIQRNPLMGVPRPVVRRRDICPLDPDQCETLFHECQKHRLGDVIILAVMTGMRKGEIFGLQWEDINVAESVLALRRSLEEEGGKLRLKEPKTKQGRRAIILDELATKCLASRRQKAIDEGFTTDAGDIVFCSKNGKHMRQSNFDRNVWYPIRERAGIANTIRFHDLRHTQATLILLAGIHPKIVQERLGHGDISISMNTYSHLLPGLQADAAAKMGSMIPRKNREQAETPA